MSGTNAAAAWFETSEEYRQSYESRLPTWAARFTSDARPGTSPHEYLDRLGYRTEFQRDRDDILYSPSFRQLAYKRQMYGGRDVMWFYTRLTHTLIVSQLARSMARGLQLDEYLAEAIALGHDLGHAPYGHAGEDGINQFINGKLFPTLVHNQGMAAVMALTIEERIAEETKLASSSSPPRVGDQYTIFYTAPVDVNIDEIERLFYALGFETKIFTHNAQSYRLVKYLEKDPKGLELTFFAYYGIFRASGKSRDDEAQYDLHGENIVSKYASFEGQVVRLADDIAWVNHDLTEDCKRNRKEPRQLLRDYFDANGQPGLMNHYDDLYRFLDMGAGERYGKFVTDAIEHNKSKLTENGFLRRADGAAGYVIQLPETSRNYLTDMKNIVTSTIHESLDMKSISQKSAQEVREICDYIFEDGVFERAIDPSVYKRKKVSELSYLERLRAVADVVAHLSDAEADAYYQDQMSANRAPRRGEEPPKQLPWNV